MTSIETYRAALRDLPLDDWEPYLLAGSNLPGPRGNLELAAAAADLGDETQFRCWAALGPDVAPENTPDCFLAFCGVVGLGRLLGEWNSQQPSQSPPAWATGQPAKAGFAEVAAVSNRRAGPVVALRGAVHSARMARSETGHSNVLVYLFPFQPIYQLTNLPTHQSTNLPIYQRNPWTSPSTPITPTRN